MEEITSSGHTITITSYRLDLELAETVRERVIDAIVSSLRDGSPRKAFLAAELLSEALRSPMHDDGNAEAWNAAHATLLDQVRDALNNPAVHPAVVMKAAQSVSWHALYNVDSLCQLRAESIIMLLDRDLPTRMIRLVVDAWGSDTWHDDESFNRNAYQADLAKTVEDLSREFPNAERLYDFVTHWLTEIGVVGGGSWGAPQPFVGALMLKRTDLANIVMARHDDLRAPLNRFAGAALAILMVDSSRHALIAELLDTNSPRAWELVSEAYARQAGEFFTAADLAIVRRIFLSHEPMVLHNAAAIARQIATQNPSLAVELICTADFVVSPTATREFFMWLAHSDTIPPEAVTKQQWEVLIHRITHLRQLDDHWARAFLKKAVAALPSEVIKLFQIRLLKGARNYEFRTLKRDRKGQGLAFLSHPNGLTLLRDFLAWAVNQQACRDLAIDIGSTVSGLCGKYGADVLDLLLEVLSGGTQSHVDVVASVLRSTHQTFMLEETPFIRRALNQAEVIGEDAVKTISSALWSATCTGGRGGIVGEPFKEDLDLKAHSEEVLKGLSKLDPAYSLYSGLLRHANENIDRQAREKKAMLEDEE
jgi:hypothetical protein